MIYTEEMPRRGYASFQSSQEALENKTTTRLSSEMRNSPLLGEINTWGKHTKRGKECIAENAKVTHIWATTEAHIELGKQTAKLAGAKYEGVLDDEIWHEMIELSLAKERAALDMFSLVVLVGIIALLLTMR